MSCDVGRYCWVMGFSVGIETDESKARENRGAPLGKWKSSWASVPGEVLEAFIAVQGVSLFVFVLGGKCAGRGEVLATGPRVFVSVRSAVWIVDLLSPEVTSSSILRLHVCRGFGVGKETSLLKEMSSRPKIKSNDLTASLILSP